MKDLEPETEVVWYKDDDGEVLQLPPQQLLIRHYHHSFLVWLPRILVIALGYPIHGRFFVLDSPLRSMDQSLWSLPFPHLDSLGRCGALCSGGGRVPRPAVGDAHQVATYMLSTGFSYFAGHEPLHTLPTFKEHAQHGVNRYFLWWETLTQDEVLNWEYPPAGVPTLRAFLRGLPVDMTNMIDGIEQKLAGVKHG